MNIFEVVSLTQHTDRLDGAIQTGILNALRLLAAEQGLHEKAENHADLKNDLDPLIKELQPIFNKELKASLQRSLTSVIRKFSKSTGKSAFNGLYFKTIQHQGHADRNYVYLNELFVLDIASTIFDYVHELVLDNEYSGFGDAFYQYIINATRPGTRYYNGMFDQVKEFTDNLSGLIAHELVHTKQHAQQATAGRDSYEYRSYLDKYKGHFQNVLDKGQDDEEYYHLYYASPQEIAGYAHTIASNMIHELGLNKATRPEQVKKINSQTIVSYVDNYLESRYKVPSNKKEQQVYRRYLKLVYIEINNYLNNLRIKLSNQ